MYRIFIVEDDVVFREALSRQLSHRGYQVQLAEDFQDVLAQFEAYQPHLVLLDISLPFFDGYYWCEEIRRISQTPILFLTSASDDIHLIMAVNQGADPQALLHGSGAGENSGGSAPGLFLRRTEKFGAVWGYLLKPWSGDRLVWRGKGPADQKRKPDFANAAGIPRGNCL